MMNGSWHISRKLYSDWRPEIDGFGLGYETLKSSRPFLKTCFSEHLRIPLMLVKVCQNIVPRDQSGGESSVEAACNASNAFTRVPTASQSGSVQSDPT